MQVSHGVSALKLDGETGHFQLLADRSVEFVVVQVFMHRSTRHQPAVPDTDVLVAQCFDVGVTTDEPEHFFFWVHGDDRFSGQARDTTVIQVEARHTPKDCFGASASAIPFLLTFRQHFSNQLMINLIDAIQRQIHLFLRGRGLVILYVEYLFFQWYARE